MQPIPYCVVKADIEMSSSKYPTANTKELEQIRSQCITRNGWAVDEYNNYDAFVDDTFRKLSKINHEDLKQLVYDFRSTRKNHIPHVDVLGYLLIESYGYTINEYFN